MAIIRDNRGAILAGDISQYLADISNTSGTPVDTNEIVNILNQFLGEGEQISADSTTISFGVYKKFGPADKVTNRTEVVTSGIWTNDTGSLTTFFTSSLQVAATSGQYYIDVFDTAATSSAQFSIAYGDIDGYGAPTLTQDDTSKLPTKAIYSQFRNVLLDSSDTYFSVYSGSTAGGHDLRNFYVLNINRERYKERLDPGNFSIVISGSVRTITLIDDSGGTNETVTTAGRVYNIVSGSLNIGTGLNATINSYTASNQEGWGLFYPDMGVILLNPTALSASVDPFIAAATSSAASTYHLTRGTDFGGTALFNAISNGADFQARRTENVSTTHFFVRANNREFNFSNNPTFVTGSVGEFKQELFEKDPHVYVTGIGLFDDSNELIAVAKVSKPVEKTFDKEIAIKVKLDF